MRTPLLLLPLVFLLSCISTENQSQRKPNSKPIHHIVTVHGLGGKIDTFGSMAETLSEDLREVDDSFEYKVHTFFYYDKFDENTQEDTDSYLFARLFGEFIEQRITPSPSDKISILTHSQGGLISIMWYFKVFAMRAGWSQWAPYIQMVDTIVTSGTPFWGSKIAYAATTGISGEAIEMATNRDLNTKGVALLSWIFLRGPLDKFFFKTANISPDELQSLKIGGFLPFEFRRRAIEISEQMQNKKIPVKIYNIGGIVPNNEFIKAKRKRGQLGIFSSTYFKGLYRKFRGPSRDNYSGYGFGHRYFESDGVVSVPSSKLEFLYLRNNQASYNKNAHYGKDNFKRARFTNPDGNPIPYSMVHTLHASPDWETIYDLVALPRKCKPTIRRAFIAEVTNGTNPRLSRFAGKISKEDKDHLQKIGDLPRNLSDGGMSKKAIVNHLERLQCDHPTYPLFFNILSGCTPQSNSRACLKIGSEINFGVDRYNADELAPVMRGFTVDFNFELPAGFKDFDQFRTLDFYNNFHEYFKFDDPKNILFGAQFVPKTGEIKSSKQPFQVFVDRPEEHWARSGLIHVNPKTGKKHIRFFLSGILLPKKGKEREFETLQKNGGFRFFVQLNFPKLKNKSFSIEVEPGLSTYIDTPLSLP